MASAQCLGCSCGVIKWKEVDAETDRGTKRGEEFSPADIG